MYKKTISSIIVIALLNLLGCYSYESVTVSEYKEIGVEDKPNDIIVETRFSRVHFAESNFYIDNDSLVGIIIEKEVISGGKFPLSEIEAIQTKSFTVPASEYQNIEANIGRPDQMYMIKYDSTRYHFMKDDYVIRNDTLVGKGELLLDVKLYKIALSDIESIQIEYSDGAKTTFLVLGIVALIVLLSGIAVAAAIHESFSK